MASVWGELKRRNVVRVAIAYAIVAWLLIEVSATTFPILALPAWTVTFVTVLLLVGFPVSLIFAWAYEITPEGLKKEKDVDRAESITHITGRKLDFIIIGVLAVALAFFVLERFVWLDRGTTPVAVTGELEKSIAVLPFANRSADDSDAYFVDGVHDDILTQLHKLSGIDKVISRTSVERYRDTDLSMPAIAAELGVATILEGSVQRAGNRVRITVQFIDAINDKHLWADNFDRELTPANVFEIQSEISTAIAESLHATLTEDEASELTRMPTDSLEAWEKYQLGKHAGKDRSVDGLAQSRTYMEEAVEIDENFALAHVGLADAIILEAAYRWDYETIPISEYIDAMAEARTSARRALALNPRLGEAYTSIGYSHFSTGTTEDDLQADVYYRKAIELSPNHVDLLRWYPQTLWLYPLNQPAYALSLAERAVFLDPLNSTSLTVLGLAYEMNGRYDEAGRSFDRAIEISPRNVYAIRENVGYLRRHAEYSHAITTGLDALTWLQDYPPILFELAQSYRQLGDMDNYEYWSGRVRQSGQSVFVQVMDTILAQDDGRIEAAIQQLEAAIEDWSYDWNAVNPLLHAYAQNDQPGALLDFIETHLPEMLDRENPEVPPQSAMVVAAAAWALRESGEPAHADKLVEVGLEIARKGPRHAAFGYGVEIADIEMYAVQRNYRSALDALTRAVNDGYRNPEWLERSHFLDPIRSEPDFVAAMDIIRADLAAQASQLEEMERSGELPPLTQ